MTASQFLNRNHSRAVPPLYRVSVGEAMHRGVLAVPLTAPLSEVAETMAKHRVHCVVALGERTDSRPGRVWGLVTDLELTRIASNEGLQGRTAGGSATTEIVTVGPADTVHDAAHLMAQHCVSHVIVVDPLMDRPVGVLSTLDVARVLAEGVPRPRGHAYHVFQLMTQDVLTVQRDTSLREVAQLLSDRGISGVPVVERNTVLGVVSQTDIVAKQRGPAPKRGRLGTWFGRPSSAAEQERLEARTAGEVMTSPAITIESWRTVAEAASLMLNRGIDRLPVSQDDKLVGIITQADLVGAFARSDAEIEHDIREEVVLRSFWIPDDDLVISVRQGEVTLTGTVESKVIAELLPDAIRRVPGVVDVRSKLRAAATLGDPPQFERLLSPH
jgi:CBS domain-containing protein